MAKEICTTCYYKSKTETHIKTRKKTSNKRTQGKNKKKTPHEAKEEVEKIATEIRIPIQQLQHENKNNKLKQDQKLEKNRPLGAKGNPQANLHVRLIFLGE